MFDQYTHIHFVGIGGIGMSALAKWALHEGLQVSGSDLALSELTAQVQAVGATINIGHSAANISETVDLVIYSPAVPGDNIELLAAQEQGIKSMTNFQALGEISKGYTTIVVTGTNGKSTTTAMLGLILEAAGYDPTVLLGSLVPGFVDGNLRMGKSRFFVVEGCEYRANMLNLIPEMIVLTNIEEDHLDYYRDLAHIQQTFQQFIDGLKGQGMVVVNGDDDGSSALNIPRPIVYALGDRQVSAGQQVVTTLHGDITLQVPGSYNASNALAALTAAMELGIPFETAKRALGGFTGIWRRFERLGTYKGAEVISDYGHHPTAVEGAIEATREFFPERRIVLCYQPHQHDRTKKLFDDFVRVLAGADRVIVTEIYDVAGRNEDHAISSVQLVEAMGNSSVTYAKDLSEALFQVKAEAQEGDVLLIMGAGDIDSVARDLV